MKLWTIQPIEVWGEIQDTGVCRCNPALMPLDFDEEYQWLRAKMIERIGPPPEGVVYPVWAWYKRDDRRTKPDLRSVRWNCGPGGKELSANSLYQTDMFPGKRREKHLCLNRGLQHSESAPV